MLLIKNADIYAPEHLGIKDILIEGNKIIGIENSISCHVPNLQTLDAEGRITTSGIIDVHEHITGGGGEGGPSMRVPEAPLSVLVQDGITTFVGLLGTDGITRSLENLLAKTRSFTEAGLSGFIISGSYGYPPVTFTGSLEKDIVLIPEVIGVKTAMSDHRDSGIAAEELIKLGTAVRRGALLAGKKGLVTIHMGDGSKGLKPLFEADSMSDIPKSVFLPTHMSRTDALLEEGIAWIQKGGNIDLTAGEDKAERERSRKALLSIFEKTGFDHVSVSSDAFGSQPIFNDKRELIGMTFTTPDTLSSLFKDLVKEDHIPIEKAILPFTANPASFILAGKRKGSVHQNMDADLILWDKDLTIQSVVANGRFVLKNHETLLKGTFE